MKMLACSLLLCILTATLLHGQPPVKRVIDAKSVSINYSAAAGVHYRYVDPKDRSRICGTYIDKDSVFVPCDNDGAYIKIRDKRLLASGNGCCVVPDLAQIDIKVPDFKSFKGKVLNVKKDSTGLVTIFFERPTSTVSVQVVAEQVPAGLLVGREYDIDLRRCKNCL